MGHDPDLRKYELRNVVFYKVSPYYIKAFPFWKFGNTMRRIRGEFFYITIREF